MKNLIKTVFIVQMILICSLANAQVKDKYFSPVQVNSSNTLSAKVNGKTFVAKQILAKKNLRNGKPGYVIISVGDTGRIEFKIEKELKVGTFVIDASDKKSVMMFAESRGMPLVTGKCDAKGTLTITEISENSMSGSFSFTAKNMMGNCADSKTVNISNGSFKVSF